MLALNKDGYGRDLLVLGHLELLAVVAFGFWLQSFIPCVAGSEATLLIQESPITGTQNVYVTAKALRIDNQKTGATIVCKAPAWDVYVYNKRNRAAFHSTADEFRASFFQEITRVFREHITKLRWSKEGPETVDGVPSFKYVVKNLKGSEKFLLMTVPIVRAEYWLASDVKLPAKACNVLARLNSAPQLGGLPVDLKYTGSNGDSAHPLKTTSYKKIHVVDPFFEVPKFTMTANERDVFIDPAGRAAIEGMFGDPK